MEVMNIICVLIKKDYLGYFVLTEKFEIEEFIFELSIILIKSAPFEDMC